MENWKKALVCGAMGAGTVLTLAGRHKVGLATIAGGLGLLASQYPEGFETVLENAPEYVGRATQILGTLSRFSDRSAEGAEQGGVEAYAEFV
jgi:hypothetical protein